MRIFLFVKLRLATRPLISDSDLVKMVEKSKLVTIIDNDNARMNGIDI